MAKTHPEGYPNFMQSTGEWIIGGKLDVNGRADGVKFTLDTPSGTIRVVTVQLLDASGSDVTSVQSVEFHVFADAAGLAYAATGGSSGITQSGASGDILPMVTKKVFAVRSSATGEVTMRWTDSASEVAFLGVKLPSGRVVISDALTI